MIEEILITALISPLLILVGLALGFMFLKIQGD